VPSQEESDTDYVSYMLRMWSRWDSKGKHVWCASLQEPGSRHTESFGDVDAMFSFLQSRIDTSVRVNPVLQDRKKTGEESNEE